MWYVQAMKTSVSFELSACHWLTVHEAECSSQTVAAAVDLLTGVEMKCRFLLLLMVMLFLLSFPLQ